MVFEDWHKSRKNYKAKDIQFWNVLNKVENKNLLNTHNRFFLI